MIENTIANKKVIFDVFSNELALSRYMAAMLEETRRTGADPVFNIDLFRTYYQKVIAEMKQSGITPEVVDRAMASDLTETVMSHVKNDPFFKSCWVQYLKLRK